MGKGDGPYRGGGEPCTSCVELARENGELRAAKKARSRTTWAQAAGGSAMVGAMVGGSLMLVSWIHGCASAPRQVTPKVCHDMAVIIRAHDSSMHCEPGATAFTEIVRDGSDENVLLRCVCAGAEIGPRVEAPPGAR